MRDIKKRLRRLRERIKPSIPKSALIVMPGPGESDEAATARLLEQRPDMVNAPRIVLKLMGGTYPPEN